MTVGDLRGQLRAEREIVLSVKVVPKSSKTEWAESLADGSWRIRLAATPEKGRANQELCRFLASEFAVPRAHIQIVSGLTSARKRVRIQA